ncbi:MAG: hypothetical protein KTR16_05820 [Acidiferrobacterales bacterium]|nr:hypothetical protein [Acidiferrobacterales bacterium]
MSQNSMQQADPSLVRQISGLIEFRKSKLSRLESVYIKGRSKVEKERGVLREARQKQVEFKQRTNEQIEALTDTYLGGDHSPIEIQKWFAKEKYLKDEIVRNQADLKDQERELRQLKEVNIQDKKAYQQAMIGVEKIQILKEELLNGSA